jgi:hypothetical protein
MFFVDSGVRNGADRAADSQLEWRNVGIVAGLGTGAGITAPAALSSLISH